MDRTERVELTTMVMISDGNGRVLIQNRRKTDWTGYSFPGGHVEHGESVVDSVCREALEETGLVVKDVRIRGVKQWQLPDYRYLVLLYSATVCGGELRSSDEGDVFWWDEARLGELTFAPGFDMTLQIYFDDNLNEELHILQPDGSWTLRII